MRQPFFACLRAELTKAISKLPVIGNLIAWSYKIWALPVRFYALQNDFSNRAAWIDQYDEELSQNIQRFNSRLFQLEREAHQQKQYLLEQDVLFSHLKKLNQQVDARVDEIQREISSQRQQLLKSQAAVADFEKRHEQFGDYLQQLELELQSQRQQLLRHEIDIAYKRIISSENLNEQPNTLHEIDIDETVKLIRLSITKK